MRIMGEKYIYTISGLTKKHGPRTVLEDIHLAFYPGAKIGVLGRNGAGKSTLLRIMAGLDTEYDGEARLSSGYRVGYLAQEPELDKTLTVAENVQQAVASKRAVLREFDQINQRLAEPMDEGEMMKLCDRLAIVQDQIDSQNLWDLDRQVEQAMDAMNLPEGSAEVTQLSGGERR